MLTLRNVLLPEVDHKGVFSESYIAPLNVFSIIGKPHNRSWRVMHRHNDNNGLLLKPSLIRNKSYLFYMFYTLYDTKINRILSYGMSVKSGSIG